MSRVLMAGIVLPALLASQVAVAGSWSLGSHLSLSTIRSERPGSGSSTVFAWPSNAFTYQPALRVGLSGESRAHELLIDSGLFALDQAGSTLSLFTATASYQHSFRAGSRTAPIVNAGAGLYREGGAVLSSTSSTFGVGAGIRHVVGDRKGTLRAEFRYDRLHSDNALGRPALNFVSLRLGFDLWL